MTLRPASVNRKQLPKLWASSFVVCGVVLVGIFAAGVLESAPPSPVGNQTAAPAQAEQTSRLKDKTERFGRFQISGRAYTVLLREKVLGSGARLESTLSGLEIQDANGSVRFQEDFPYALADGHFSKTMTAMASVLPGNGGEALVIRFIERTTIAAGTEGGAAKESWQILGVVNGHLQPFGAVLPVGQGAGITVGGVVTGVMVRGGVSVVPLASTADALDFRVWEGHFFVLVPVRVDWVHGQWGEGEQCYGLVNGALRARGCRMRVDAYRAAQPENGEVQDVRLFAAPDGDSYNSQLIAVRPDSHVDFLSVLAVVHWQNSDRRETCDFRDVWLETRVDGTDGWVRGEQAFAALGLPRNIPR